MKPIQSLLIAVGLIAAALTASAQTPVYGNTAILTSQTYLVNPTNLATPQAFFVGDRRQVAIQMTVSSGSNAGATNIYYFAPSVDGISYDTNAASLFAVSNVVLAASYTQTKVQNVDTLGYGYLSLINVSESNLTSTNTVKRSVKLSAP